MTDESGHPVVGKRPVSESDAPTVATVDVSENHQLLTARIAQRLRDAGLGCEIVNFAPTPPARRVGNRECLFDRHRPREADAPLRRLARVSLTARFPD